MTYQREGKTWVTRALQASNEEVGGFHLEKKTVKNTVITVKLKIQFMSWTQVVKQAVKQVAKQAILVLSRTHAKTTQS